MKSSNTARFCIAKQGFALVVTLSLMILLTVIAVGLLTLSTISLRASSQGEAAAAARANARLALMMAIGELQRELGPDSRISAPQDAGTIATGGQPRWTADEAAKAKINAGPDAIASSSFGITDPLLRAQSPPNVGHRSIPKLENFTWQTGQRAKSVSTAQVNLAANLTGTKVVARAWCDAVIQRVPDYIDPTDAPEAQDGWPQASNQAHAHQHSFWSPLGDPVVPLVEQQRNLIPNSSPIHVSSTPESTVLQAPSTRLGIAPIRHCPTEPSPTCCSYYPTNHPV